MNQIDESRIAQEVTVFADKVCVDEELSKTWTVTLRQRVKDTLIKGGAVGRRLDFHCPGNEPRSKHHIVKNN